jgi:hypothetical protein
MLATVPVHVGRQLCLSMLASLCRGMRKLHFGETCDPHKIDALWACSLLSQYR